MLYRIISPSPPLRNFVKEYTLAHFRFGTDTLMPVKPFPVRPQQSLVFYLRGSITSFNPASDQKKLFPKIAINGAQLSRFDFHLTPEFLMVSIDFQPGMLSRFLNMPLSEEFIDERIDAEALLNPDIRQLYEQLVNSTPYTEIIDLIETYLWKRIEQLNARLQPIDFACRLITENPTAYSIVDLADQSCLSISQFERRFSQQIGISPKLFARTNRFHQAFLLKDRTPSLDWLSIALQTGYTDYQHLVKDFRQFAGTTPKSLLLAQANAPERILKIG